jgi:hypothetical protein
MAWEDRNGTLYYYRKRREGGRVVSEYVGKGYAGEFAQMFDGEDRHKAEHKRRELRKAQRTATAIDATLREAEELTRLILRAHLLLAGYHFHKGQWRKIRE